ncbi:MAG: dual specificity protein phosphatase family protein [Acidiferrobacterales bacterium]|nr:dual specificity protein phosphatase family protein [Acidiferrobacterales bacterium]
MLNFDPVTDKLLVGTCPKCTADIEQLKEHDVHHVVCLQSDSDFRNLGIHWPELVQSYQRNEIQVSRIAMTDFDEDNIASHLSRAAAVVSKALDGGGKVYVHCTAGRERSPTVAAAWLMQIQGLSAVEACQKVNQARPSNPYLFMLKDLERSQ